MQIMSLDFDLRGQGDQVKYIKFKSDIISNFPSVFKVIVHCKWDSDGDDKNVQAIKIFSKEKNGRPSPG